MQNILQLFYDLQLGFGLGRTPSIIYSPVTVHTFNIWSVLLNYELTLPHMVIANLTKKHILFTIIVTGHTIPFLR